MTQEELDKLSFNEEARYRCEQLVVSRVSGVVQNHATTKREFVVKKQQISKGLVIRTELVDNIIQVYPDTMTQAIALMSDLDLVKSDTLVLVDPQTGKISQLLNHNLIIDRWTEHKIKLKEQFGFLRSDEHRAQLDNFINLAEKQILDEQSLIQDLNTKLFFDLFFDKYLVTDKGLYEPYERRFNSQLFEETPLLLNFKQTIQQETPDHVTLLKESELDKKSYNLNKLENIYERKFKPMIHYKFSEFNFNWREQHILNTSNKWIESSEVNILEEVKNNIEIIIDYKLKKIK